jgi:hypothetical protein
MRNTQPQGLGEIPRPTGQRMIQRGLPRPPQHHRDAFQRFKRPDQHRMRRISHVGHNIKKMVDPINEVYISRAPTAIHDFCTGGAAARPGMTGAVSHAIIRFRLHDPARGPLTIQLRYQYLSQQLPGDRHHVRPVIKRVIQFFNWWHQIKILSLKRVREPKRIDAPEGLMVQANK